MDVLESRPLSRAALVYRAARGLPAPRVRVDGLTSDAGQLLNGLTGVVATAAPPASAGVDARVGVQVDDEAVGKKAIRLTNLVLLADRAPTYPSDAPYEHPAGLTAPRRSQATCAGDILVSSAAHGGDARPARACFLVYMPGLRLGEANFLDLKSHRFDPGHTMGWSSAMSYGLPAHVGETVRSTMLTLFAEGHGDTPPGAWNPLTGPGWPGVYTDRRFRGVRDAPAEDVLEVPAWSAAAALFDRLQIQEGTTRFLPLRVALRGAAAACAAEEVEACMRFFLAATEQGRALAAEHGVSCTGAHVAGLATGEACAFVILTVHANASAFDVLNVLGAGEPDYAQCPFELLLRGEPLEHWAHSTSTGCEFTEADPGGRRLRPARPPGKPDGSEYAVLVQSACGRFAFRAWATRGGKLVPYQPLADLDADSEYAKRLAVEEAAAAEKARADLAAEQGSDSSSDGDDAQPLPPERAELARLVRAHPSADNDFWTLVSLPAAIAVPLVRREATTFHLAQDLEPGWYLVRGVEDGSGVQVRERDHRGKTVGVDIKHHLLGAVHVGRVEAGGTHHATDALAIKHVRYVEVPDAFANAAGVSPTLKEVSRRRDAITGPDAQAAQLPFGTMMSEVKVALRQLHNLTSADGGKPQWQQVSVPSDSLGNQRTVFMASAPP